MKRYIYTLLFGALLSLSSCVMDDPTIDGGMPMPMPSGEGGIQIIGSAEDFDVKHVGTRANENGVSDSFISEMTMLIFKSNGEMLTAYNANQEELKSSHINIRRSNPTFLIETSKHDGTGILASMEAGMTTKYYNNKATDIDSCSIYIVANAYHLIGERLENGKITTIDALNEALLDTNVKLNMPYNENTGEYIGLPMIGCARDEKTGEVATFDLRYHDGESNNNAVATIPLKKLYSKVCFSIQVNSNQLVTGQIPEFRLDDVEVFNVPSLIRMGYQAGDYILNMGDNYLYRYVNDTQETSFSFSKNGMMPKDVLCRHSSSEETDDVVSFHFYMPEHKVTPYANEDTYSYPANLPKDNRQYFKPKLIKDSGNDGITNDKIATFVRIHGSYTDHNGNIHDVAYDIYLGQDNTDDFEVMRNQQLDNKLIITGITNHKDAYDGNDNTISIDHRVSMSNKGYTLSMEREAILDAHFEVRPLDIELQPGSSMTIEIDESDRSWVVMEDDAEADTSGKYVSNTHLKGVRKYFTTTLVNELNTANSGKITIKNTSNTKAIHRIWFYVDENPNVYDKLLDQGKISSSPEGDYEVNDNVKETDKRYRVAKVNFYFAKEGEPDMTTPTTTINFQQWNLWRVWSDDGKRYYDIEHEEEYLNNYASDQQYGQTKDGMPWGLEGIPLSDTHRSIVASQEGQSLTTAVAGLYANITEMADDALDNVAKYDFYISRDFDDIKLTDEQKQSLTIRDYSGIEFNREIATTLKASTDPKAKIDAITLVENPLSAFAYCYHKNKRNDNGQVVEQKWYLPAIDEIEDIALGAYDEFDKVFQKEKYWSCQPAYNKESLRARIQGLTNIGSAYLVADYYIDNEQRARATSIEVKIEDGNQVPYNILSGTPDYSGKMEGTAEAQYSWIIIVQGFEFNLTHTELPIPENDYLTKTPGNLPRTQSCRIRAVYRSGTVE